MGEALIKMSTVLSEKFPTQIEQKLRTGIYRFVVMLGKYYNIKTNLKLIRSCNLDKDKNTIS